MNIKYLDLEQDDVMKSLLVEGLGNRENMRELKIKALSRLGITVGENEKPLEAWVRHLSEINNVAYTIPCDLDIATAVTENPAASRFMFWLA